MKYAIDEKLVLPIGGVPQSVRIRSADESLPVLLFLHGGPGVCDRHWVLRDQSDLALFATMVCWDQRGAGLSWSRTLRRKDMTVDRMVEDAHELIGYLKRRFRISEHVFEKNVGKFVRSMKSSRKKPKKEKKLGKDCRA